jgi:hypothetical protein
MLIFCLDLEILEKKTYFMFKSLKNVTNFFIEVHEI